MKVQYNSLTMLFQFMQEFGPILSRVYCILSRTMFKLSICSSYGWITQPQTCYWLFERKYNTHVMR
jgi:hypothetical protein